MREKLCQRCGRPFLVRPYEYERAAHCSPACRLRPVEERFWAKVRKSDDRDGCWLWTGTVNHKGYGYITDKPSRTRWSVHRLSYVMAFGPIPEGRSVCHRCDTPACVRPEHLWLGSAADNTADMMAKGRHRRIHGEALRLDGLTECTVREIRARYAAGGVSHQALADQYGVAKSTISHVLSRRTWRDVV